MEKMIAQVLREMIAYSEGNLHDINHLVKVHSYAHTIAVLEGLDDTARITVEVAAILHDIACPLCRKKYGNTNGKAQEEEGMPLAEAFLKDFEIPQSVKDRVVYLVGHHHSPQLVDGCDYQILLEADYLVNADEGGCTRENIIHTRDCIFRTASGTALLESIYLQK